MKYYAGIGSRTTPQSVLHEMSAIGEILALKGYILRSGGAVGADSAFEEGCNIHNGQKEIFLPWDNFMGNKSNLFPPSQEAFTLAKTIHPVYEQLSPKAKSLIARNMHQILGSDLKTPVDFVICFTEDGCETEKQYGIKTGGTGSAIVLASKNNIPVYNLNNKASFNYILNILLPS